MKEKSPNSLINESSPYLLQHAYNPVNWFPYGDAAFQKAKAENKLLLFSVGYSACHWCHVMEKECFEDEKVAALMNTFFVNVKVDREERTDIDMIYMHAVQMMTGHGGWPLNCFALPDGRPIYGGTYFNKEQWMNALEKLSWIYENEREKMLEYATHLAEGMKQAEVLIHQRQEKKFGRELLLEAVSRWKNGFDNERGGPNRSPKFPLPNNYLFLLRHAWLEEDHDLKEHVDLTLQQMAQGGIYDQLRGGFARYSVDKNWKVPHFEKMLYDNAQLVLLYAEAYRFTKNSFYEKVVRETLNFMSTEWIGKEGCFFSALDADSEGEEGKYYVWTKEEIGDLLGEDAEIFGEAFSINEKGYWENGNYILVLDPGIKMLALKHSLTVDFLQHKLNTCKEKLREAARNRKKPGLDDKSICSWNAMACSAFCLSYMILGEESYRKIAIQNAEFIIEKMMPGGKLQRSYKNGVARIEAMLDDHAFFITALKDLYLITADEKYLLLAKELCDKTIKEFTAEDGELFYFTNGKDKSLIMRTTETSDNVIPASNSQMALNLFWMGKYFAHDAYIQRAERMLAKMGEEIGNYASGYSNWAILTQYFAYPLFEIVIVGKDVDEKIRELHQHNFLNAILAVSVQESNLPLLVNKHVRDKTLIYICSNNTCMAPAENITEALKKI